MNTLPSSRCSRAYQRADQYGGATLLFVLIMLLVVSIIGVAAARSTLLQERMAANSNVRNVVFEAAESALAAGEIRVANTPEIWKILEKEPIKSTGDCHDGICPRNTSTSPVWINTAWDRSNQHKKMDVVKSGPIQVEPKYLIEDLGQTMASCDPNHIDITKSADCPYTSAQRYFRVVSFAKAYETQVLLQSTYLDPNPTREPVKAASEWKAKLPQCNGKDYNPATQKCCPADNLRGGTNTTEWINGGSTCPTYCEVEPNTYDDYDPTTQKCCNPGPDNKRKIIGSGETCPVYCNKQEYDESKEVCCNVKGVWTIYPGTNTYNDCPKFCGDDPRGPGQVCCWKGGKEYSYTTANSTSECPKFCPVNGAQVEVQPGQICCDNASKTGKEIVTGSTCPSYCDGGKVLQPGQFCCSIPALAGGGERIVNGGQGNCPVFCGANELVPGKECCGYEADAKLYDPLTQQCCEGSNNATKVIPRNEVCCRDQYGKPLANPNADCPIWCGTGNTAIRKYANEQCCTESWQSPPIKANLATEQCCSGKAIPRTTSGICPEMCNGQSYDPGIQQCCDDLDANGRRRQHAPMDKNSACPQYCNAPGKPNHNKLLSPGQLCCTVKDADNYGEIGPCEGGSGAGAGT